MRAHTHSYINVWLTFSMTTSARVKADSRQTIRCAHAFLSLVIEEHPETQSRHGAVDDDSIEIAHQRAVDD